MTESEILLESIGEHAVAGIGKDHLRALTAIFDPETSSCDISVTLLDETESEFLRATDKLVELRVLFLEEADIDWTFHEAGSRLHTAKKSEKQFSYA